MERINASDSRLSEDAHNSAKPALIALHKNIWCEKLPLPKSLADPQSKIKEETMMLNKEGAIFTSWLCKGGPRQIYGMQYC